MAAGGLADGFVLDKENWERLKKIRRLRELFHGRFPDQQCGTLLRHFKWDLEVTVPFILDAEPSEIHEILGEDEWQIVGARKNAVLRDLARRNIIGDEIRQFGCKTCDHMWWRKVPVRKPVSRCKTCGRRVKAIPLEMEWGWAKFQCKCHYHEFFTFGMMELSVLQIGLTGKSKSLCRRCRRHLCEPLYILRPLKRDRHGRQGRRSRIQHECTAYNCYNKCLKKEPNEPIVPFCVHPISLRYKVPGEGSENHVSTGSTVKTFLTQDDLAEPYDMYEPSLADIDEVISDRSDNT